MTATTDPAVRTAVRAHGAHNAPGVGRSLDFKGRARWLPIPPSPHCVGYSC